MKSLPMLAALAVPALAAGCASSTGGGPPLAISERAFTLGLVQKEIRVGMSQAEVIQALGSPNILTRDSEGREAWVYDKIATEATYSKSGLGVGGGVGATAGDVLLLGLIGASKEQGHTRTSQQTLTVVIKFDKAALVDSFSFHASRF